MMRFCRHCKTERAIVELICEGTVLNQTCGWDLSNEPIRQLGWRPQPVTTREVLQVHAEDTQEPALLCSAGHPMQPGDLICLECGAELASPETPQSQASLNEPEAEADQSETQIDGWRLLREISRTDGVRERYLAQHDDGRQAILTLYRAGAEPDPAVYSVLRRLPRDHVPEIIATGRWNDRAYEVAEELTGGTLAGLGIVIHDLEAVRHIVRELGHALHAFSEAGLRHRDLRPGTLLVRQREPLDLVISGFGSARLSEFDLDIVSPLEISRYMAPEAIAGGVAAASDWWSLGMILLEQITQGACFEGINPNAYLIHVLAHGVQLPPAIDPQLELLLRGLLARDRHQRWQWAQVCAWLDVEAVTAPAAVQVEQDTEDGATIILAGRRFHSPGPFALAAAEEQHWAQALDHLLRGVIATWGEQIGLAPKTLAGLRQVAQYDELEDDFRLMLALKILNPDVPLIQRGHIVTPGWLLEHPLEGYRLITGPVPDLLETLTSENWLSRLKVRAEQVRQRARHQDIELDEPQLRIYLLSTSRARLAAQWQERQRLLPDSEHPGIRSLTDRRAIGEEDLIVLLSAAIHQFRSVNAIVAEAERLATDAGATAFDSDAARALLLLDRPTLFRNVDERIAGFARCGLGRLDAWADQFRIERRMPLANALVLLAVPSENWLEPQKQQYVTQILDFFEKKITTSVMRGPLVRMTIGKTTGRVDVRELDTARRPAAALLDALLQRQAKAIEVDPAAFSGNLQMEQRLHALHRQSSLYKRDTGIDGLHLGFPFLLTRDARGNTRTRIAPLLLWPVKLHLELGTRGQVSLAFDSEREEVRLNPALEALVGVDACKAWRRTADELLGRSSLKAADVMDAFGVLASSRARVLEGLPSASTEVRVHENELACAGVLFHVTFMGQALGEDLRQLKSTSPAGTGLETALRLRTTPSEATAPVPELERFFTAPSDPSQEEAVMQARQAPGLLIEGPPGTGKSQTIVNMVADAIGRHQSLLIVCQKHAALEVVHKRLVAEGLGSRVVMLDDVNRDRERVIRGVREQLESLFGSTGSSSRSWQAQRERLAARIEALEGELDRYHSCLHALDERTGLSYRQLLGELIELEQGEPVLQFPALRQRLGSLDITALAHLEEACAPLVRLWLPARFEGSPLARLKAFPADAATLESFRSEFAQFVEAEASRLTILQSRPASFDVAEPEPYRHWLEGPARTLLDLADDRRQRLTRWLPLFGERAAGYANAGARTVGELEHIEKRARQSALGDYSPRLSPALSALPTIELNGLIDHASRVLDATSWFSKLNPTHYLRRRTVSAFLTAQGVSTLGASEISEALAAARLEAHWRPLRAQFSAVQQLLSLPIPAPDAGLQLASQVGDTLTKLRDAQGLSASISTAPRASTLEASILEGTKQSLEALLTETEAALARQAARERSLNRLSRLADWAEEDWGGQLRISIEKGQSNTASLHEVDQALPQLGHYQQFRVRAKQLSAADLAFLALLRERQTDLDHIPSERLDAAVRRLINHEARLGWKQRVEQEQPALLLDQAEAATKIEALAQADSQMRHLNRELLGAGIETARLGSRKQWEDVTRLTGRRSRRLREFVELGADLGLMHLRPVWLMNPDVASRVLPLRPGLFDAVIYDEASQMPVEFALPTLFRGRVMVVSGDEKQMPPTAFFSSRVESDEAELFDGQSPGDDAEQEEHDQFEDTWNRREIKDCPDLLQLAKSVLPTTTLEIHYRSAYRELIGFSNASFYGDRLSVPVRHPPDKILAVRPLEMIRVDGLYQDQTNVQEAERVVEYVAQVWREPVQKRPSIGVVTFNRKQADLIEERMEQRAEHDDAFRVAYAQERERSEDGEDMAVFVKNVENVQGDERDVIVFSSTFGRNGQGTFRRNFGVLGQTGGERRLNVAVTRARKKVVMVTSMPIPDISDMLSTQRAPSIPRDYLQGYLEYARALSAGEFATSRSLLCRLHTDRSHVRGERKTSSDGFTDAVAAYIRSLGWEPVGADEGDTFGLDFAIEDPATGLYALGIECDSPRHALLKHARAREIWRRKVLGRSIPYIHRVSSQGWHRDGGTEREALKQAIEKAVALAASVHTLADTAERS
ncbi:superfamily I DNA and/or RNA helicase [Pseudoxanthomonas sp. 3HH-4]|uniref:AAA domain-containing protein n=1 Tax=Pseudoxanthomonas sp. 3HH-4 TaxID=1690214 RepID=UPI001151E036|nr:AAA domain-containing protein [Pseudoxanthomonas sp. 3HH-4]TQM03689.1 superfamily I DNA and/or RNA helicase [Pseudoxanthomonas sp. 3HH-4]